MTTTHTRRLALSTAILAACAAGGALADDPKGPAQCNSISDNAERLACYDRLAGRASAKAPPTTPAAAAPAAAPVSAAPVGAAPVGAAPVVAAPVSAAPDGAAPAAARPVPAGASTDDDFGLSKVQKQRNGAAAGAPPEIKKSLTARVTGFRKGPDGRPRVLLDNGQSWEYEEDGDYLLAVGDSVTIQRASLGSFLLTTPAKLVHRVRRIR
jgi:hypothetical protein